MSDAVFDKWLKLQFNGIRPGWFWERLAESKSRLLWRELRELVAARGVDQRAYGVVVLEPGMLVSVDPNKGKVAWSRAPDLKSAAARLLSGRALWDERWLDSAFPQTSRVLAQRRRVKVHQAFYYALRALPGRSDEVCEMLHRLRGLGGQAAVNFLMYAACDPGILKVVRDLDRLGLLNGGVVGAAKALKLIHDVVRQTSSLWCPVVDISGLHDWHNALYLNTLLGRYAHPSLSATSEIESRTTHGRTLVAWDGRRWTHEQFKRDVMADVRSAVPDFHTGKLNIEVESLDELMDYGWAMASTGSAPNMRNQLIRTNKGWEKVVQPSKALWVAKLSGLDVARLLNSKPDLHGTGVDKFEAGKLRLLLPGPPVHWLAESLALFRGDASVMRADPSFAMELTQAQELADYARRMAVTALQDEEQAIDSDYADYNILHTFDIMRDVWLTLAKPYGASPATLSRLSTPAEVANYCLAWTAGAIETARARSNRPGAPYLTLVRGLWTGWRSTSFLNTLLNRAYANAVRTSFKRLYGYDPVQRASYCGDDMAGRTVDDWTGLEYLRLMDDMGLDAQAGKQLLSNRKNEFLRIISEDGVYMRGSLARAVANGTSADAQSDVFRTGVEEGRNASELVARLSRRGANDALLARWHDAFVVQNATVRVRKGGRTTYCAPPKAMVSARASHGGLRIFQSHLATQGWLSPEVNAWRVPNDVVDSLAMRGPARVGHWYARKLFGVGLKARKVREVVQQVGAGVAQSVLPASLRASARAAYERNVRAIYSQGTATALPIAEENVRSIVDAELERFTQAARSGNTDTLHVDWGNRVDSAIAAALGPAAPAGTAALRELRRDPTTLVEKIIAMGGRSVANNIVRLKQAVGQVADVFLKQDIEVLRPSLGVISPVHSTVFDHCLAAVLQQLCESGKECTSLRVKYLCDQVSRYLDERVVNSDLSTMVRF